VETGRLLTTSEQREGATGDGAFLQHSGEVRLRPGREHGCDRGRRCSGARVLEERGVHKAQHEVLQLVCDDRKAGDLWTADGADPVDKAPYKYTINGAVGAVFSYCVHRRGEGECGGERLDSRPGSQGVAGANERAGKSQDGPSSNRLRRLKSDEKGERSASVYVFVLTARQQHEW
jgi:hypothetical protein